MIVSFSIVTLVAAVRVSTLSFPTMWPRWIFTVPFALAKGCGPDGIGLALNDPKQDIGPAPCKAKGFQQQAAERISGAASSGID